MSSPVITPLHTNLSYSSWSYLVPNDLSNSPIPHSNFRNSNSEAQHLEPNDKYFENLDPARIGTAGPFTIYSAITTITAIGASISAASVDIAGKNTKAKAEFFKIFRLFSNGVSK